MYKLSVLIPLYNRKDTIKRCIDSIPKRDDIEIIVCDDGSTDDSIKEIKDNRVKILINKENKGVGYTMNRLYDEASGEYVVPLGSDDYFYIDKVDKFIKELDGTDMVYFDMLNDNNFRYELNEKSKDILVGSVKATKRKFLGNTRCPEIRKAEDLYLYQDLQKKKPSEKFTHIILKHYTTNRDDRLTNRR